MPSNSSTPVLVQVDTQTDRVVQQVLREKLHTCTVISVAHRLETILESDRVAVLSDGKVKEFASPSDLLSNSDSQFTKMVGSARFENLTSTAHKSPMLPNYDTDKRDATSSEPCVAI